MAATLIALLRPHSARERFAFVQTAEGWIVHRIVDNRTSETPCISRSVGNQVWEAIVTTFAEAAESAD